MLSSDFWSPWGRRWSGGTDSHIETRERYRCGVCSGFCTNWMAWWSLKAAFSQGIVPRVADWPRLSRWGKNFGSTDWSCHSHRQYDSHQETQQGFYFPFTKPPVVPEQEVLQVGHARISPEKKDRRYHQNLCLYCGQTGHVKISCPTRPKQHASSAVSQSFNSSKCVKMPVKLAFNDSVI